MNRTIKFRAWDKKENKWLLGYEYESLGGFSMFGEVMMMGEYASLLSHYFSQHRLDDIALMQFTGLTDKSGKEIYEGDVLEYVVGGKKADGTPWKNILKEPIRDVVRFKQGGFVGWNGSAKEYVVIGNIYENPELLQADNETECMCGQFDRSVPPNKYDCPVHPDNNTEV